MKQAYTKFIPAFQSFFLMIAAVLLLAGCVTDGSSAPSGSWGQQGVVTQDPNRMPNIAWQTWHQRQELTQQDQQIAQQKKAPATAQNFAPVKVALLLPLTGKSGALGQSMLKAAQMALFDVGSANFELLPLDTLSTAQGAMTAAQRAVANRSDLILGPIFAEDVKAVKPITSAANIPMIAFTTDWTLAGNDTYVMGFLPFAQVTRVTQYAQANGFNRFAAFAPQTEYADVVISTLQRSGAQIVRTGRFAPTDNNLAGQVEAFAQSAATVDASGNPSYAFNALMLPLGGESLRSIVSVLDLNGIKNSNTKLLGTGLWDDESLTRNPALYGGLFAAPDPALRRDFETRYQSNYGGAPVRLATLAYDATALAAVLSRNEDGGAAYSRQRLTNSRGFAGIDGLFRFRNDGLNERGLAVLEIQNGRARVVDPSPTAFGNSGS